MIYLNKICSRFFYTLFLTSVLPLYAQRGESFVSTEKSEVTSTDDFEGFFDVNTTPHKRFAMDLPTGTLSYGLSKKSSLTMNVSIPVLFLLFGNSAGTILKYREKIYTSSNVTSAISAYGMYFVPYSSSGFDLKGYTLTSNTTFYLNPSLNFTFNSLYFDLSTKLGSPTSEQYAFLQIKSLAIGTTFQFFLFPRLAIEGTFLYPLYQNIDLEFQNGRLEVNSNVISQASSPLFYRILANMRIGSETWFYVGYNYFNFLKIFSRDPMFIVGFNFLL